MPEAPNLSVVTTTFKNDPELAATLGSLSTSGLVGCELVVADGLSQDDSNVENVVGEANLDPSISVTVIHGPDAGPYHAMNKAILASSRDWLWFMNSGDRFTSESIELYWTATCSSTQWAVGSGWLGEEGKPLPAFDGSLQGLQRGETPCHQSVLLSRALFARHGLYDLRYRIAADYDLMLAAAMAGEPARTQAPVCIYQGGGLSDIHRALSQREYQLSKQRRGIDGPVAAGLGWLRVAKRTVALRRGEFPR